MDGINASGFISEVAAVGHPPAIKANGSAGAVGTEFRGLGFEMAGHLKIEPALHLGGQIKDFDSHLA